MVHLFHSRDYVLALVGRERASESLCKFIRMPTTRERAVRARDVLVITQTFSNEPRPRTRPRYVRECHRTRRFARDASLERRPRALVLFHRASSVEVILRRARERHPLARARSRLRRASRLRARIERLRRLATSARLERVLAPPARARPRRARLASTFRSRLAHLGARALRRCPRARGVAHGLIDSVVDELDVERVVEERHRRARARLARESRAETHETAAAPCRSIRRFTLYKFKCSRLKGEGLGPRRRDFERPRHPPLCARIVSSRHRTRYR